MVSLAKAEAATVDIITSAFRIAVPELLRSEVIVSVPIVSISNCDQFTAMLYFQKECKYIADLKGVSKLLKHSEAFYHGFFCRQ